MDIEKLVLKKNEELLILNVNGKKRKYHLNEVVDADNYSLYICKYYRFFYTEGSNESAFNGLFNAVEWTKYQFGKSSFPYLKQFNKRGMTKMCITILYDERGKIDKVLDHDETVEFFDSIMLIEKLKGVV